ncbi:MAG: metallophosphoesterase, partial [Clostridia bacterium]|nr:metallophosphoesterase [Clostridia bacterium]
TNVGNSLGFRAGDSWNNNLSAYTLNTVYSCTVVWKPSSKTITSTIKNGNTVIVTGTRTNDGYATLNKYTRSFAWRCEDGSMMLDNIVFTDGTNTYSENFRVDNAMINNGVWGLETVQKTDATAPVLKNGVVNMAEKNGFTFNWQKVQGVGEFNSTNIYTFEFDTKITDKGDGNYWTTDSHTRALYVAFGGWFNLVELPQKNGTATLCGSSSTAFDESKFLNTDLHITINWEGRNAHASIADKNGNILLSGSRSSADFVNMSANQGAMTNLVFRCEDGAAQIDNFSFSVSRSQKLSNNALSIAQNKQAVYTGEYIYDGSNPVSVRFGDAELFYVSNSGVIVGNKSIASDIPVGNYTVKAYINPSQEMVSVEVVYPDGSVVRRGFYTLLGGDTIEVFSTLDSALVADSVTYADITLNDYTLTTTEPTATGFGANVYNLITSFDDAKTTRNFAWTAKTAFVNGSTMAVQYRVSGTDTWSEVNAVKEVEKLDTGDEDFYKCDVTGLTANTTYEYRIGIKGSTDYTNKWSKTYTFTTSANGVDDFSFIAIGDTQGITWEGTTVPYKGFMYAKAAIDEAYQEVPNPAFMLHTGDVVETASNRNYWNMYFKALGEYGATTPNFVAMGNHDTMVAGDHTYFDLHFNHPNNGGTAALDQNEIARITDANLKYTVENSDETIYSYNYGNAHFIVLNTGNYTADDKYLLEAQRQWLINDLEANRNAKWTVVMIHEPVYHRLGGVESRPELGDVFESYGVDLVIQGHSHLVTRTYPMKNGEIVTKNVTDNIEKGTGTIYTTIGSTALNHDGINDSTHIEEMFSITIPELTQSAYTTVSVSDTGLVVTTKQINGLVLDTFTIEAEASIDEGAIAAEEVAKKINAIGEITEENYLEKEQAIIDAEEALEELIATYGEDATETIADAVVVLENARETYEYFVGKVANDKAMAQAVMDKIDAIENFDEDATLDARASYESLTDVQKAYVTNLQKLEEIEAILKDLVYGDINGDMLVTVKDALRTLQHSTGKIDFTPIQIKAADVTTPYGEINSMDALLILQYSVGKINSFDVQK